MSLAALTTLAGSPGTASALPGPGTPTSPSVTPASSPNAPSSAGPSSIASPRATNGQPTPVTVTLMSMTPRLPDPQKVTQPVTFVAMVANNTDTAYTDFTVGLERGAPINRQNLLDTAIKTPPPTNSLIDSHDVDEKKAIPAHGRVQIRYRSTPGSDGMCLCSNGVYPFALVVRAVSTPTVGYIEVGRTLIFVPSFIDKPAPVSVSWIWPLVSRPHRSISETTFTDEDLAAEVAATGRLDRALKVAELTRNKVRMTLLVDPDLLDSLAVMASPNGYRVRVGSTTVAGTGGLAAAAWLDRLRLLTSKHDIVLTPFGDPDINAATRAGLKWSTALEPQVQARLLPTVDNFTSDLAWPADGILTSQALDAAVAGGASTVLLSDAALPGLNKTEPRPDAVSPLPSATGTATALVTDSALQRTAAQTFKLGAIAANDQQTLLAQLAIRPAQDPSASYFAVITPNRYVDTDPQTAADTITSFLGTTWSKSISVGEAINTIKPIDRGALQVPANEPVTEVSASSMASLAKTVRQVSSLRTALKNDDASALLGGFNTGIQRAESTGWRTDPAAGVARAIELRAAIQKLTNSVHLVEPTTPNYSLSSSDSPIVLTVANDLSHPVNVRVAISPGRGAVGFSTTPVEVQNIPSNSIRQVSIFTHVDRIDKFKVFATLTTPGGGELGSRLELSVRSTALGGITKTVTGVAAGVLGLALLVRLGRRIRRGYSRHPGSMRTAG